MQISENSQDESVLEAAVRELLTIDDEPTFFQECEALEATFPSHSKIAAAKAHWLIRRKRYDEALALIEAFDFSVTEDLADQSLKVELLYDAQAEEAAEQLFQQLMANAGDHRRDVAIRFSKRLFSDGKLIRALEVVTPVRENFGEGGKGHAYITKLERLKETLEREEGRSLEPDENCRIVAMKRAILKFRNRQVRKLAPGEFGRLTLITGGLGPGGAERQLTRLAIELERARKTGAEFSGVALSKPVEVLVRSHGPEKQNDFYLQDILSEGVELREINKFPLTPPTELTEDADLIDLLEYLPPSVNFGVRRITRHFIESGTDTASIWQDGACLFAGLAALLAGVPHIQIAIRGLPPVLRRHLFRPEYEELYRAMAAVPGVTFLSNSVSGARAYAEWLDIPLDRFEIVYNGVQPMSVEASVECERRWNEFAAATSDASHTVGGVFRFDTDKQPLLWIRFAARYLKRHPDSRIVLVGGGRLLDNAIQLAEDYQITDRILFVGRSTNVGYWMSKMDVLVLLSRYEGLPNVLIEAQYMGVKVVTTPAGGAAECVIEGVTGHVLACAEKPEYAEIVEAANNYATQSHDSQLFAPDGFGRAFLESHFSIPNMLVHFVSSTSKGLTHFAPIDDVDVQSLEAA